jgi:hypothetical protein
MAMTTVAERLEEYHRRHRELAAQIAEIGIIASGSVTRRSTRFTSVACRCNADPPAPHGPYWQWTAKVSGKTVNNRLTTKEAKLYQAWVGNDRRIRGLLDQMRTVDAKAAEILLREVVPGHRHGVVCKLRRRRHVAGATMPSTPGTTLARQPR